MTLRQRQPRIEDPSFLAFLRKLPCCVCGAHPPVQAAHLRFGCPERGKPSAGLGTKPDDRWAVPLCPSCHLDGPAAQHRQGEARFWSRAGIDPFAVAEALYGRFRATVTPSPKTFPSAKASRFPKPATRLKSGAGSGHRNRAIKTPLKNNRKYNWPSRPLRGGRRVRP